MFAPPFFCCRFVRLQPMKAAVWISATAGLCLLGAHLLPLPEGGSLAGLPTLCPLKAVSGWPCPGCGLTRGLVFFAHGEWSQALRFHPLSPLFYFGLWLVLVLGLVALAAPRMNLSQRSVVIVSSTVAGLLLITWVVRIAGVLPYPYNF